MNLLEQYNSSYRARVDTSLARALEQREVLSETLQQAMIYGTMQGGKRIRPFLVYATGNIFNIAPEKLDKLAAAIECIHAYSLIHDDLPAMDDDELRRGQPTCHIAFDEATAILAGDALQTLAFELIAEVDENFTPAQQLAMVRVLANASGLSGMCGGQALDLEAENKKIDLAALERIHSGKTGALIRAAVTLGALSYADVTQQELALLDQFAQAIGLAFQVQDDILDITSDTQTLGKPQGSDQALNKSTYPALLGLAGAKEKAQALYQESLQALAKLDYNTELLELFAHYIIERNK
ncbi:(2E,6E)-farnesyl diphosphate synthase [Motilimonas sp. E26]|uniref:(2E,6E)-farnesyl diphosphate synthase n=1 Tax=Motilimonas sp. E26 TaxID=2865674 RepID=UPI001E5640AE|nr:(2E,6E)-farnesyl diphosphate synthase [Motilimonas sp. E26]MCE0557830.1 (2E,6E)-farnesyl diphosphate synthase [Motilimonas sp. E26]